MTVMAIVRHADDEPNYTAETAARLAGISQAFLRRCVREGLVQPKVMPGGGLGFSTRDVRHLARIRRLRDDLGLDLAAVEVVLHLRRQVVDLLIELSEQEHQALIRERQLLMEIQELRRQLAEDALWR
ncbi:MAG: MerR family transcriptional regulator [Anaerolineae bacterium]|nr:MerR family transcriptional regulator [Anaerolineae bacterium]